MLKKFLFHVLLLTAFLQVDAQTGTRRFLPARGFTPDSVLAGIDLRNAANWFAASTPGHQPALFPEALTSPDITRRVNCARIAWYIIDPLFYDKNANLIPANILNDPDARSGFYVCQVYEDELFPERVPLNGIPVNLAVLNVAFYPGEKGLFNFDAAPGPYAAGIEYSGNLKNPQSRWGGIMRGLESVQLKPERDTVAGTGIHVKYIDFWLMDPFVERPENTGGQLFFNLGDVSEDIVNPGILDVETGDMGYDNMNDEAERVAFKPCLDTIAALFGSGSPAYATTATDPSCDQYHYFRGSDYDQQGLGILDRFKCYKSPEGNSTNTYTEPYNTIATSIPNTEDLNRNGALDTVEAYCRYTVDLVPSALVTGTNHITGTRTVTTTFINGVTASVRWFHFQIPIGSPDTVIGNFNPTGAARFMRIFLKGFNVETHLRFATLELSYMKERTYRNMISVFPNPTVGEITIDFDNRTPRSVMVFDLQGRLLRMHDMAPGSGQTVALDLSSLANGLYLLKIAADEETILEKVVVERQ